MGDEAFRKWLFLSAAGLTAAAFVVRWYLAWRRMRNTGWRVDLVCWTCRRLLSHAAVFHNHGVCPHCGQDSGSAVTNFEKVVWRRRNGRIEHPHGGNNGIHPPHAG